MMRRTPLIDEWAESAITARQRADVGAAGRSQLACHDERREVRGGSAGDEAPARRRDRDPARSASHRSTWFSACTAPDASSHEIPFSDDAETTLSNSSDALVGAAGIMAMKRVESADSTAGASTSLEHPRARRAGRCPSSVDHRRRVGLELVERPRVVERDRIEPEAVPSV